MRFSTPYALAATMLVGNAVAVHANHRHLHERDLVVVTDNESVYETITDTLLEDASGNVYSTVENIVYTTEDQGIASTSAPAAASTTAAVSTAVAATTEAAVTTAAAVVDDAAASGTVIVATYNGETFSWTTTFGAAATVAAAAAADVSVAAVAATSEASSSYVAPSSTYVAPSSSASPTTFATSYAASSSSYVAPSSSYSTSYAASSTSSASASSSTSTGARGLSYNDASLTVPFEGSSVISWAYNWGSTSDDLSSDFEFVPMLWGLDSSATDSWDSAVSTALAAGSTHLLSFNEPDLAAESDITAADAAAGYKTYMNPYSGSAKLGAPAVTNGGYPGGLNWLKDFLNDCDGECTIDFVPIHWYDTATNYVYFKEYVEEAYVAGGNRTLWITEFGATGTDDEQNTFLEIVMPWLDSLDYVERYAYFMCEEGSLVSGSALSTLGSTYSSYVTDVISSLISAV